MEKLLLFLGLLVLTVGLFFLQAWLIMVALNWACPILGIHQSFTYVQAIAISVVLSIVGSFCRGSSK